MKKLCTMIILCLVLLSLYGCGISHTDSQGVKREYYMSTADYTYCDVVRIHVASAEKKQRYETEKTDNLNYRGDFFAFCVQMVKKQSLL